MKTLSILTFFAFTQILYATCLQDGQRTESPWNCCSNNAQGTSNAVENNYNGYVCSISKKKCSTIDEEPTSDLPCCAGLIAKNVHIPVNKFKDTILKVKCNSN